MQILVTGNKGFLASHMPGPGLDLVDGFDIREDILPTGIDVIFHMAANASIPNSFNDPIGSHSHNVLGTIRVLEHARKTGAMVVFSSSSSVYGEPQIPTKEDQELDPMSPYAMQKMIGEAYCGFYWQLGVKSCALRYFNIFGEGQERANGGDGLALPIFLKQYKEGKPFTVVGDGEQRRDFIYVKDVVDANLKAAEWLKTATQFESFNIGSGTNYSINEVCDMINKDHPREHLPPRPEPRIGLADITKAKEMLGWNPTTTLKGWLSGTDL